MPGRQIEFELHESRFVGFLGLVVRATDSMVLRTGSNSRDQPELRAQKPLQPRILIRITDYGQDLRGGPASESEVQTGPSYFYLSAHHC